ncbi:MAG TPA: PQQ-binding-like beta-propeller repeat protein [Methanothrix sp.]|nr:PQQ-binding-like beta-propeller repeat protein [Methanothrix sp.]HPJ83311.1 PQQ-binding-like beta-propeller repeat protein [Methanothrix sp.]HPR65568.1 PQQ-binding-like beta-propeller repeat protein [Methanothrix sp.]
MDDLPTDPQVMWSVDLHRIDVTPIIASDRVYVLADNGTLWALDKLTGDAIWNAKMDGWIFQTSTPALAGGRIFAATDSGDLAAFDARTGEEVWTRSLTDRRFEVPIASFDGRIYLGEGSAYGRGEKRYFCLDEGGDEVWTLSRDTTGYMWCGAAVAGDYLVYGSNDGLLLSVDRKTGRLSDLLDLSDGSRIDFAASDPGRIRASVSYKDGFVYTASEFSAERGYAWKVGFDEDDGSFENLGWSSPVGFSTSTPAVYNGRVYLGVGEHGYPGALTCLNDSTGDVIWSYPVDAGVKSSPVISAAEECPRIVFTVAKVNGSIYCIEDGGSEPRLLWRFDPPDDGYILAGAAVSDGRVYFGTEKGLLYCLSDVQAEPSANATQEMEIGGGSLP